MEGVEEECDMTRYSVIGCKGMDLGKQINMCSNVRCML